MSNRAGLPGLKRTLKIKGSKTLKSERQIDAFLKKIHQKKKDPKKLLRGVEITLESLKPYNLKKVASLEMQPSFDDRPPFIQPIWEKVDIEIDLRITIRFSMGIFGRDMHTPWMIYSFMLETPVKKLVITADVSISELIVQMDNNLKIMQNGRKKEKLKREREEAYENLKKRVVQGLKKLQ